MESARDSAADRLNAKISSTGHPGLGRSDFKPGRPSSNSPGDVVRLADLWTPDTSPRTAMADGSPYVPGLAIEIPGRLNMLNSSSLSAHPGVTHGMDLPCRRTWFPDRRAVWPHRLLLEKGVHAGVRSRTRHCPPRVADERWPASAGLGLVRPLACAGANPLDAMPGRHRQGTEGQFGSVCRVCLRGTPGTENTAIYMQLTCGMGRPTLLPACSQQPFLITHCQTRSG